MTGTVSGVRRGPGVSTLTVLGPFLSRPEVYTLMILEPDRNFSAVEGQKGNRGRGNSMARMRRLRGQSLLEPMVLPLICCMTTGQLLPLSGWQVLSAGPSAVQSQLLEACAAEACRTLSPACEAFPPPSSPPGKLLLISQKLSAHLPEAFRGVLQPLPASPAPPSDPRARVATVFSSGSSSDLEAPWGLGLGGHRGDSGVFVE